MRNLLSLFDLSAEEIQQIFDVAADLKAKFKDGVREPLLAAHVMGLLFEKPSLRTRVSFETAMLHLGGGSMYLGEDVGWGSRESIADFSRVLGQYVDVVVCRAKSHKKVEQLAQYSPVSIINGLTDWYHPCQALTDLFTMREVCGDLAGLKLAYVGDAYNVARSLAIACGKLGVRLAIAAPTGYELDAPFLKQLKEKVPQLELHTTNDPIEAVENANAVYTDVWISMGQEAESQQRLKDFASFQINQQLMDHAPSDACFLHCLPARRGEEVTDEVMDGPHSSVIQQAANRMHVQKGLIVWLLNQ